MMNLTYFKGIGSEIMGHPVDSPICLGPLDNPQNLEVLGRLSGKVPIDDHKPTTIVQADAKHLN